VKDEAERPKPVRRSSARVDEKIAEASGVPRVGVEVQPGETVTLTGDGSGEALPLVEQADEGEPLDAGGSVELVEPDAAAREPSAFAPKLWTGPRRQ
jgi:hypothetical protein